MRCRSGKLAALVALSVALVFAACQLGKASSSSIVLEGARGVVESLVSLVSVSPDPSLSISWECLYSHELPEGFESEVASGEGREWIATGQEGSVGYFEEGKSISEASGECAAALEGRGWTKVESGSDSFSTFAKEEGAYRWLAVTFVEVPSGTSVVFQWSREGGRSDG